MLDLAVDKRLGDFQLSVRLAVPAGQTLVVVGESGSGKSTLLRLLAGLATPDRGHITLEGRAYYDAAGRIDRPAWERSIGFVPQDYALFPHLSVLENVGFGLRASGMARAASRRCASEALERLGIANLAGSRPAELSGGQQQRAALARALVLEPDLLLLDEPLSAVDLHTRQSMRSELRRTLDTLPCVTLYVTHAPSEALVLGDQIAVMEDGHLVQVGTQHEFLLHPRSPYVATFLGINLFPGRIVERALDDQVRVHTAAGDIWVIDPEGGDHDVFVMVKPQAITLRREPPSGSARNAWRGPATELLPEPPAGDRVRVTVGTHPPLVVEVTRGALAALDLREDDLVWATFEPAAAVCYR